MSPANHLRVLVVDDFAPFADHLAYVLRNVGHCVRVAYGGADALRVAEPFRPHALISAVHMPGLSGFELARTFAERFPDCGVVFLTMDRVLMAWTYNGRVYQILNKIGAVEALFEFLRTCHPGE